MAGYQKDFDGWNEQKKCLRHRKVNIYFEEREIWWCAWGVNVGWEQDGSGKFFQRPIVILKKMSKRTCMVAPLTTSTRKHPMRFSVGHASGKKSQAILSQIKVIDTDRFVEKMGIVDEGYFQDIQKAIRNMF